MGTIHHPSSSNSLIDPKAMLGSDIPPVPRAPITTKFY